MAGELTVGKAQVEVGADTEKLKAGVESAKRDLASLGTAATDAGKAARTEFEKWGKETGKTNQELNRFIGRTIGELERLGVAAATGGRNTVEFYEAQLKLKGIPETVYKPLTDSIRQTSEAAKSLVDQTKRLSDAQSFINSLKQQVAESGKSREEILKMRAAMLGVSGDAAPLIDSLAKSSRQMGALGMNSRDTALAMRFVAPQITDIVTALASGQAPFTVMIQQGGQLKDMFGGIIPSLKAVTQYIVGMINPVTIVAAAVAVLGYAWKKGADETTAYNKALILTGNSVGLTAGGLADMAKSLSNVRGTQGAAAAALAEMATSTVLAGSSLERFTRVAIDLERTVGKPIAETRKEFEELAKGPSDAVVKLNEKTNFLTADIYRQVRALEDQGKVLEAATVAQNAYADAMEGRTGKLRENLGSIERAWNAVASGAKAAWDAMLNLGRTEGTATRLDAVNKQIEQVQKLMDLDRTRQISASESGRRTAALTALQAEQSMLEAQLAIERLTTQATVEQNAAKAAGLRLAQSGADALDKQAKKALEIAKINQDANLALTQIGADSAAIERDREASIRKIEEKYKETTKAARSTTSELDKQARLIAELGGLQGDFYAKWADLAALFASGKLSPDDLVKLQAALLEKQPAIIANAKAEAEAVKESIAAMREREKVRAEENAEFEKTNAELDKTIIGLREETSQIGLSTETIRILKAERLNEADAQRIQRYEQQLGEAQTLQEVLRLGELIDKLRQVQRARTENATTLNNAARTNAMVKAAEDAEKAWQKTADDINKALTDSLFRAAEAGKSFFETLRDALKGMFNNLVLRPIIQAGVGSALGAIGFPAAAQTFGGGAGSLGNLASLGSSFSSLGSLGSIGSGLGMSFATSSAGQALGLSVFAPEAAMYSTAVGSSGAALTGAGATFAGIASVMPYIAIALAVYSMLKRDPGGPKAGGQSIIDLMTGAASPLQTTAAADGGRLLFTPTTSDADLAKITTGIGTSVAQTLARFGGSASGITLGLGFDTDPLGEASNRLSSFVSAGGRDAYRVSDRDLGRDEGALKEAITTEASRLTLAALQAADLPGGYGEILKRLDPAVAAPDAIAGLLELVESIRAFGEAMGTLPGVMGTIADLSATAREQLINFAGGLDVLQAAQQSYYTQFYSDAERTAQAQVNLAASFGKLGFAFEELDTRGEFRAIVEALDLTTEAGRQQYAALIQLAGPLDAWIDAMDALAPKVDDAATAVEDFTAEIEAIQTEMDALVASSGDLSQSLADLENPSRTIADQFIELGTAITTLEDGLAAFLGDAVPSLLDQLTAAGGRRDNILGAQASLGDTITDTRLRGFLNRGDLQGGIGLLKSVEATLFADLETTTDPAGVTAKIVAAMTQRYDLEAQLITDARELRRDALQDEIGRLETLRGVVDQIGDALLNLRTGSLSALAPRDQLAVSSSDFMSVLAAAQGGDLKALQALSGSGTQYLTEAQSFFASGGDYARIFSEVTGALDSVGTSLGDVPTQIGVAQDQLLALDTVVDNTGEMATDLETLGGTLSALYTANENNITTLVSDIHGLITDMKVEREGLQLEYENNRARWTALGEQLQSIDASLKTVSSNATLVAAA